MAKEELKKFENRISGRKWDPKTIDAYLPWVERFLEWMPSGYKREH